MSKALCVTKYSIEVFELPMLMYITHDALLELELYYYSCMKDKKQKVQCTEARAWRYGGKWKG